MTEEEKKQLPAPIIAWLQQEQKPLEDVATIHIQYETRQLAQDETNFSPLVQHVHTGLVRITVTMMNDSKIFKVFTKQELQRKETAPPSDDSPTKKEG